MTSAALTAATTSPLAHLWLLRLLVPLKGMRAFVTTNGFTHDGLATFLGLGKWTDVELDGADVKLIHTQLRALHKSAENKLAGSGAPPYVARNVDRLSTMAGLSQVDCRVLEFAVMLQTDDMLRANLGLLGSMHSRGVFLALSVLLKLPEAEVRRSLAAGGMLARSGLVTLDRNGLQEFEYKFGLLSNDFADTVATSDADPVSLLRGMVTPCLPAELALDDYEHVVASLAILRPYLKQVVATGRKGVNIFLHGAPGTGKSQLAKVLAKDLGCELFEVSSEDDDGDPVSGEKRLNAYRAAQGFFAHQRSLIVFDEVEDVFSNAGGMFGAMSVAQTRKGWLNRMLEDNLIPTLWLSNSVASIDPAFIRRFDMIIALPVPPKKQRERILQASCGDLLDPVALSRITELEALAPAVVTRAAGVVSVIRDGLSAQDATAALELLITSTLEAQGHVAPKQADANRLPDVYDPAFINADTDLGQIAAGLLRARSGRLCLYGPPGTGKTAYARWLAEQMAVPLVVKRASDLLSRWVGGSEKNIARAFRQADEEGAVLLIDEVDSFLQDRRGMRASWEVTQVNEMLTQMESFSGVFIASTNLMEGLDQAALRRFDLKARFGFLLPAQAGNMLGRYGILMNLLAPSPQELTIVSSLSNLALGDFAAVHRQSRFRPIASVRELVIALCAECALKASTTAPIGFVH